MAKRKGTLTQKDLRSMATAARPGQTGELTQSQINDYLAMRRELGWPYSRSLSGRLVSVVLRRGAV